MQKNKEILLIDGNSILYRSFFSTKSASGDIMSTKDGVYTNAIHAFLNSFFNLLSKNNFSHVYFAFDKGKKTFRHKIYDNYKANRQETPFELINQFQLIRDFLNAASMPYFELDEYEADDILGKLSKHFSKDKSNNVYIFSSDKDLYQLLDDNVFIVNPSVKSKKLEVFTTDDLFERWGITPQQVPDFKGLIGDSSDNIKGVGGIGEKTAQKLLTQFHSIEEIYNRINEVDSESVKKKLVNDKEQAFFSKNLTKIIIDFELDNFHDMPIDINVEQAAEFLKKYELLSIKRIMEAYFGVSKKEEEFEFEIITKWDDNIIAKETYLYFETVQENYHNSEPVGFALILNDKNYYYEPNIEEMNGFIKDDKNIQGFLNFLQKTNITTYDSKKLLYFLLKQNIEIDQITIKDDMMLACYLINSNQKPSFKNHLNILNINYQPDDSDLVFNKGAKKSYDIDTKVKAKYFLSNAIAIKKSQQVFIEQLFETEQLSLYKNIEIPFAKVLAKIEHNGVLVDTKVLHSLKTKTKNEIEQLELKLKEQIVQYTNEDINIASPKQIQRFLYETLKLSKNLNQSTDKENLEKLIDKHPIVPLLVEHRKISKTYNTYLVGLEKCIDSDKMVRTIYNQTLTATGRLSSSEPNMQNLSVNNEKQKEIRKIFVCEDNQNIISFDYAQIELRIVSDIANESGLIEAFNNNKDIHKETAQKIFKIDDVSINERRIAKTVNFGILYGQSDSGLAKELKISRIEASNLIANYYNTYPGLAKLQTELEEDAKNKGYVKTIGNRRRYIPEIKSPSFQIREFGKRVAMNSPIQGTAADIIKIAMIEVDKYVCDTNTKMIAQIHDEIIIVTSEPDTNNITEAIKKVMENAYNKLCEYTINNYVPKVKLEVSSSVAKNWYYLK